MVATLDVVSNGRFILFYDYGWRRAEFDAYGFPSRPPTTSAPPRWSRGSQIIKGMLTHERFSFERPLLPGARRALRARSRCSEAAAADLDGGDEQPGDGARHRRSTPTSSTRCRRRSRASGRSSTRRARRVPAQSDVISARSASRSRRRFSSAGSDAEIDACFERMEQLRPSETQRRGHPRAVEGDQPGARAATARARISRRSSSSARPT